MPFYVLALLVYGLLFSFWQYERVPVKVHAAAFLVAATALIPLARWYAQGSKEVPIFELIVLSYAAQFSVPVYTQPNLLVILNRPTPLAWDDVFAALLYAELGIVSLMIAYSIAARLPFVRHAPKLDLPLNSEHRSTYLVLALLGGGFITLLQTMGILNIGSLGSIFALLSRQMNVALILLAYDVYGGGERRPGLLFLLYGTVVASFIVGLTTGLLENALIPLALLLAVRWHATRRFPWVLVSLGILLYLILNPAKFTYREEVWYGDRTYGFGERVDLWGNLVAESATNLLGADDRSKTEQNITESLARFDLIHKFAYVQKITPEIKPFYLGQTYTYFLYAWVPRVFWPDKPLASEANEAIDINYRLKLPGQSSTIGIGQLPEAYANFGVVGIVLVMGLQGLIFALLDSSLNGPDSDGGRAIYLSVMIYFLNGIGSSAAILFGALLQQILVNAVILRVFATGWRSPGPELESERRLSGRRRRGQLPRYSRYNHR
ncbi:MAG: hypothetical protein H6659_12800 [Ardenticatenaceae bacterium]|nr:hypothetical protein [Ardenticatenaceae bacterium]